MAIARTARIVSSEPAGSRGRLVHFAIEEGGPLGFTGGQYVIVNTGVPRTDGRQHKRAYSIISEDTTQESFTLAVYALEGGPGSHALHAAPPGATFPFSGPWGSYLPDDSVPRRTLLVATDSGITAALGLLRGRAFVPQLAYSRLVWMTAPDFDFLSYDFVRSAAQALGVTFEHCVCPGPNHPERLAVARGHAASALRVSRPERVYLSGDGATLGALREDLFQAGMDASTVRLETFFNHPSRKAAA